MTAPSVTRDVAEQVRLVVADVDGTLVTPDKILTTKARAAVRHVIEAGIAFTITSGRPPLGMKMLIDELHLRDPITAFNGGLFVRPDLSVIRERLVPREAVQPAIDILSKDALDVWIYTDTDWRVRSRHAPHVDREEWTVKFPPTVVATFEDVFDRVVKIVGVSDDHEAMARCVTEVQQTCGQHVSAALSQPYYLDVTHPKANKGEVITALSALLAIPTAQIATIGDMPNDVLMFQRSGVSIAMANASAEVQHAAKFVTKSNTEEGFALAMERFVLGAGGALGMVKIVVVMGVAGSGKTTVGTMLADAMHCAFLEGDSLHSAANVEKMSHGLPLTDADRAPWLAAIHARLLDSFRHGESLVVGCSALKQSYRTVLADGIPITWVYLKGSPALIRSRLQHRTGHYMKADMLASQLEALEEPSDALIVDISHSPGAIVEQILAKLRGPTHADIAGSTDRRKGDA
jgi:carbohydrate kinase (thermoresistant glucokinase family)/Cof subfamily protein (haloacid dehalogenase superfamily)